ncbi:MAG: beta-ketoacyl-[acyl-carrier-protein] synthase family protein, partial [Bacteroidota bacterium]
AAINEAGMGGFNAMQAISVNNDEYKTASRPYDKTRDGFVMGEGGGALILEELEHAKKRGAKIYAEMLGGGMSADAHHLTAPHPEGKGARHVMINALQDAALNPEKVDYINVHGTATPVGDGAEIKGIKQVFGDHSYDMNISSTKSMTGHLLGAAGAVELIASVCAINKNMVPPTINLREQDPNIDNKINYTFNESQERNVDIAISNTFGFGGHNASVIVGKYTD